MIKRFKTLSSLIVVASIIISIFSAYYLSTLYQSIMVNVEHDIRSAMIDMDVDEMWERILRNSKNRGQQDGMLSGALNAETDSVYIIKDEGNGAQEVIDIHPFDKRESYANTMLLEMSDQLHQQIDSIIPMEISIADSILTAKLALRGLHPEFVIVEKIGANGKVLVENPKVKDIKSDYETFTYSYLSNSEMAYRAYISPLTALVFDQMRGVIITTMLMVLIFTFAFYYLFRTIRHLRSIEEIKDDFVNNMTHELKTPIAIAYSANDALLNFSETADREKSQRYLTVALKQLNRLNGLVENILSMSMERRKTIVLSPEEIQFLPFVNNIIEQHSLRINNPCEFKVCISPTLNVTADPTHLANIINNLIDNAIKYSKESVIINISADSHGIKISDNGIGIPRKSLPMIFNKFYRVPHGDCQDVRGYGIGLYYVKSIVEKMGWTIVVSSRENDGSVFTINFSSHEK